jgi:hypothetical protein
MDGFYVGAVVDKIEDGDRKIFYPYIRTWDENNELISEFFAGPGSSNEEVAKKDAREVLSLLFDEIKEHEF